MCTRLPEALHTFQVLMQDKVSMLYIQDCVLKVPNEGGLAEA